LAIDYSHARRVLARRDPILRDLMRRHGPCGLAESQHTDLFVALLHAIVSQQLSTRAAATIAARVEALMGGKPTPSRAGAVSDPQLRAAGLSGQKVRYLRDLCARIEDGTLPHEAMMTAIHLYGTEVIPRVRELLENEV
jgi:DNA-3-methyladenine glycosylase II